VHLTQDALRCWPLFLHLWVALLAEHAASLRRGVGVGEGGGGGGEG